MALDSDVPLGLDVRAGADAEDVRVRAASPVFFARVRRDSTFESPRGRWYEYARLADRSSYLRWRGLGEFVVSGDGRDVRCRRFRGATAEAFRVYLVQRALSFAMVKRGLEPLHATAIAHDGAAIAFLGDSGTGKSTLAAACLRAGDTLVTDDLLVARRDGERLIAMPGPKRLKLFPSTARRLLGLTSGPRMNAHTRKIVVPVAPERAVTRELPLRVVYVLAPHRSRDITIETLGPRDAFHTLLRHTFNYLHRDRDRLQRLFDEAADLSGRVPVKRLSYPRRFSVLPALHAHLTH